MKMTKSKKQPIREKISAEYDEVARKNWLTGFKVRKDARRAEAMVKQKDMELEVRRAARAEARKEAHAALEWQRSLTSEVMPDLLPGGAAVPAESEFADDFSRAAFGASTVVVTTSEGLGDFDAEGAIEAARDDELRILAAPVLEAAAMARATEAAQRRKRLEESIAAKAKMKPKSSKNRRDDKNPHAAKSKGSHGKSSKKDKKHGGRKH